MSRGEPRQDQRLQVARFNSSFWQREARLVQKLRGLACHPRGTRRSEVMLAPVAATMALTRVVVRAAVPISAAEVVAAKAEAPRVFPARAQRGPRAPFQPVQKPQVAPRHVVIEADLPGQTCRCPRTKIGAMGTARRSRTIRSTSQRTNAMLGATRGTDRSPQTITKTVFGCGRKQ